MRGIEKLSFTIRPERSSVMADVHAAPMATGIEKPKPERTNRAEQKNAAVPSADLCEVSLLLAQRRPTIDDAGSQMARTHIEAIATGRAKRRIVARHPRT